ncbi:glycosyltransferase [Alteromonas genovensis]|uniref:glycosyltransferase n=1 Tax=Alteromonas genovensis TaxID=471225 RepID=UPI002FE11B1E
MSISDTKKMSENKLVSFVIPHKGREDMLIATLESIKQQTIPAEQYEVILVSQNENVSHTLFEFEQHITLSIIYNDQENSISHSRNLGAASASGLYLAFLDADVSIDVSWTQKMVDGIENKPDTVLMFGTQVISDNARPMEIIRTCLASATSGTYTESAPGANLFLKRETFVASPGFPEELRTCEDIYFTSELNRFGRIYHYPDAQFVHLGEDKSFGPMFKKEIWRGQSNIASTSGRPIPLRELPSFIVPFAVTLGIIILLLCLLYSQTNFAIIFSIIAGAPLLAYTFRLKKLVGNTVSFLNCLRFYLVYFPARAIGTLLGARGAVTTSSHK